MAVTIDAFYKDLHAEHVQEAALLYEQWRGLARKPGQPWRDLLDVQDRIEAHIDALVLGAAPAMAVCLGAAAEGEAGELFAAALACCRQQQAQALAQVLRAADLGKPAQSQALVTALRMGMPEAWAGFASQSIEHGREALLPVLAAVSSARQWPHAAIMLARLQRQQHRGPGAIALVEGLGRLRAAEAEAELRACLRQPDTAMREAAIQALWRMDRSPDAWPAPALWRACLSDASEGDVLRARISSGQAQPDDLLALGVLGQPLHWQVLYQCLGHAPWAQAAAQALHWATGADLFEDVLVPEPVDEEALFEPELQAWRQHKKAPVRLDGQPFGERERQLSTDPETWRAWFTANLPRFDARLRYRLGHPHGPQALLAALKAPQTEARLRALCALELAVRHACPDELDVHMGVREQVRVLGRITAWAAQQEGRFEPGAWYLHGRRQ